MRGRYDGRFVAGWAALLCLAAVTAVYYVTHKPFDPAFALHLVKIGWQLVVAGALVSLAGALGRRLLPAEWLPPLAALALQGGLGLGVFSLGLLGLAAAGLLYPAIVLAGLVAGCILLRGSLLDWWRGWGALGSLWWASGRFGRLVGLLCGLVLTCGLGVALAPPLQFDGLVYHSALPQQYLSAHGLVYVEGNMFWGMPQAPEMLTAASSGLAGLPVGPVLGWGAAVLALCGLLGLLAELFGGEAAWAGAAALLSGFTLAVSTGWGYNDWWTILFGVGFLSLLLAWKRSGWRAHLALAGVFAGLAMGAKYSAGLLLVCGAVAILLGGGSLKRRLLGLVWFGAPALLVFSPWMLKNLIVTGSPFYPLLIPAGAMTPYRLELYQGGQPWGNWLDVFLLPLRATYFGVHGAPGYSASLGPLLLGLGLAAGLGWRERGIGERRAVALGLQVALPGLLVWMVLGRFSSYLLQSRLYMALFPALALLAAAGFAGLGRIVISGARLGVVAGALAALALGLTTIETLRHTVQTGAPSYVLGLSTAEKYLDHNLGWFAPAMRAVQALPEEDRALLLWEPRSLYCLPSCQPDEVIDRWLVERQARGPGPAEILQGWRQAGYTHLLLHQAGADFVRQEDRLHYTAADWEALEALLESLELVRDFGGAYRLYRLGP